MQVDITYQEKKKHMFLLPTETEAKTIAFQDKQMCANVSLNT